MTITVSQMQREVVQFAMEEMRNRGLEEAAQIAESYGVTAYSLATDIRRRKRDPRAQMTDWWAKEPICDFAPMGA